MLIPCDEVNILNTFRVMIILRLLLLLTNLHLKLLSTQGTGADKLLSTQRVNSKAVHPGHETSSVTRSCHMTMVTGYCNFTFKITWSNAIH